MEANKLAKTATARATRVVAEVTRSHLGPLVLVEAAAFGIALLAGWEPIAYGILGVHVIHMGVVAARAAAATPPDHGPGKAPGRFTRILELTGHGSHGLGHGSSHLGWHGAAHGLSHRLDRSVAPDQPRT